MSASLIVHRPTCIHEHKLLVLDKLTDSLFFLLCLSIPPHRKELHLNLGELFTGICDQLLDDSRNDWVDWGDSDVLSGPREVLVHCFQPAYVVMRVRDHMHEQMVRVTCCVWPLGFDLSQPLWFVIFLWCLRWLSICDLGKEQCTGADYDLLSRYWEHLLSMKLVFNNNSLIWISSYLLL